MQTSDKGMREIAKADKAKVRSSTVSLILASSLAYIAALANKRTPLIGKVRLDRCGNVLISGKNRKNAAQAAGRRSVMRIKLAAKREKAKRRRWQERMAAGGAR